MPASLDPRQPPATLRPLAAWARPKNVSLDRLDIGFLAGAALAALDAVVRSEPPFAGAWRNRLALAAAAETVRMSGRHEDLFALRDAWCLRRPGDPIGAAGSHLAAWRSLARPSTDLSIDALKRAASGFGLSATEPFADILALVDAIQREPSSPLRTAARVVAEVLRLYPQTQLLGYWLADVVLAQGLRWPLPLPLLAAQIAKTATRSVAGVADKRPAATDWDALVAVAYGRAATAAVDLAGDLSRRCGTLIALAPKLRAKGATIVVTALLEDDALAPASRLGGMSDRGMRRLCDRLAALGAVRELTHRSTFRLYGL